MSVYDLYYPYFDLIKHDSSTLPDYLLGPFLATSRDLIKQLERHRSIDSPRYPSLYPDQMGIARWHDDDELDDDLWLLYGFSRVNDFLLLPYQDSILARSGSARWEAAYRPFWEELGFAPFGERPYSPFHHEIVEVAEAMPGQTKPRIEAVFWPGLMFGAMLFSRAGVRVSFPEGVVDKRTAEESTLYFTYQRRWRKTNDLSLGWGHNSQWRTRFHRCYESPTHLHFNVDGQIDISSEASLGRWVGQWHDFLWQTFGERATHHPGFNAPNDGLLYAERKELLLHRCFVRSVIQESKTWYPYDDTLTASKEEALWLRD